jgi:hypothetical protein
MFEYPASSNTDLIDEPAISQVPSEAGISFTKQALYFKEIGYGTVLFLVKGTSNIFLYAS